ncbi:LysR family transcriptional regulator [Granulicella mallensis]|jgi:DNA-binding transcriptional LysR family regulator|uniref:Transcriptional regulator, LysR family n=1 Tax=Granulicella mallensis (strain ATCC BAA-1857 / DSM 23137 / MP5ACTX8) TaxID=682795 RepID=G8NW83_GRAMM|nr:LysR family transcriptional regulator [Granulicella mallensis]AEU36595.1 transcriptional regulator, LysR family [Granulicella mallensis MP5ACTX8]
MDFDWLNTFLEVARQRSFSRAGEKLHVTQPSISAQIRALETHLGHRLLDRGGSKVTLTAAGRVFQPFAEQSLIQLKHIQLTLADLERMPRGTLTVSANDSTALYVLPLLISKFKKQYPRVALNIVRAERSKTLALVLDREVEFGIVSLPVKDPRLHVEVVHEDKLVLVVPAGHPLTTLESVTLSHAAQYGFLVPKEGRRREMIDHLFVQNKTARRIAMELDSSELLKRLIIGGLGISFLPRINVVDELNRGLLQAIDIEGVNIPRDLALISRNDLPLTRAGNAFFTLATGTVRSSPTSEVGDFELEGDD